MYALFYFWLLTTLLWRLLWANLFGGGRSSAAVVPISIRNTRKSAELL